jgi:hypothetical protein
MIGRVGAGGAADDRWIADDAGAAPAATRLNRWVVPVFNGEPRLVKTPLAYWSVAGRRGCSRSGNTRRNSRGWGSYRSGCAPAAIRVR